MKIQKTELAAKLNQIKGVVPKKTTMPILQGILVKEGYLIANNLEPSKGIFQLLQAFLVVRIHRHWLFQHII